MLLVILKLNHSNVIDGKVRLLSIILSIFIDIPTFMSLFN